MAEGLLALKGAGYELRVVAPEALDQAIDSGVAAVMVTDVDYRTGARRDMQSTARAAREAGAALVWDLAHSAGALEVDVEAMGCDFAVGCTYKYLNGGPGSPGFIYVRPDLQADVEPALSGWMGHAAPFAFELGYRPAAGIARMRVGTPPIVQLSILEQALKIWDDVEMRDIRTASLRLSERFIAQVDARCPDLRLLTPRDPNRRGSQVSFAFDDGYALMQALISRGLIGDFRAPDVLRFGLAPLYIGEADIDAAVDVIADCLDRRLWDNPEFRRVNTVT